MASITGTSGFDSLTGTTSNDSLSGLDGNDTLSGGAGNDTLLGGTGNDVLDAGVGSDSVDGGPGTDILVVNLSASTAGVTVALNAFLGTTSVQPDGAGGLDTVSGVEEIDVTGSASNDVLAGSSGHEVIEGGQGNDTLTGNGGADTFAWDSANLTLGRDRITDFGSGDILLFRGLGTLNVLANVAAVSVDRNMVSVVLDTTTNTTTLFVGLDASRGADLTIDLTGIFPVTALSSDANGGLHYHSVAGSFGTNGNDSIDADFNGANVQGAAGNDTIIGNLGNDFLSGGDGDDVIDGAAGSDVLSGGAGNDVLLFMSATSAVRVDLTQGVVVNDGTGGGDTISGFDTISGTVFDDTLQGDATFIVFAPGAGNDSVIGGGGGDGVSYADATGPVNINLPAGIATGAAGVDTLEGIYGGQGSFFADTITLTGLVGGFAWGRAGNDTLFGGSGDETFSGGSGSDSIIGAAGTDLLDYHATDGDGGPTPSGQGVTANLVTGIATDNWGNTDSFSGIENINGSVFGDTLTGDSRSNVLKSFESRDSLTGGAGDDTLDGGSGADVMDGGAGTADAVAFGSATHGVNVDMSLNEVLDDGTGSLDTLTGIENVYGTVFSDTLKGDGGSNLFMPGFPSSSNLGGHDLVVGNGAANGGVDAVSYEDGATTALTIDLRSGTAQFLNNVPGNQVTVVMATLSGINGARGGGFNDTLIGSNVAGYLWGLAGNDSVTGGVGNDTLVGGSGNDTIDGGAGIDTADYGASTTAIDGGIAPSARGIVVILAGGTAIDNWGHSDTLLNIENVVGSDLPDSIVGNAGDNVISGNGGNDTLDGDGGNDTLAFNGATAGVAVNLALNKVFHDGQGGVDTVANFENVNGSSFGDSITGSVLENTVRAGAGNDTIDGGSKRDVIAPGSGNDSVNGGTNVNGGQEMDWVEYQGFTPGIDTDPGTAGLNANLGTGLVLDPWGGVDTLTGIEGVSGTNFNDTLQGGSSAVLESFRGNAGNDSLVGGSGFDEAVYDNSPAAVFVTLGGLSAGTAQDGWGGTDTLVGIEYVQGSQWDDTLVGSSDNLVELFDGNAGNDSIDGKGGTNIISYASSTAGANVNLLAGTASDGFGGTDRFANIQYADGGKGNDTLLGNAAANQLRGDDGNDQLTGGSGGDMLWGGAGDDTLDGGSQRTVQGWDAAANASAEFDLVNFADASAGVTVTLGTDGTAGTATGATSGNDVLIDVEDIVGSPFADSIRGSNRAVTELFLGNTGNDTIFGTAATGTDLGTNLLDFRGASGPELVSIAGGFASGADGSDVFSGISGALLDDFSDTVIGDAQDNFFSGGQGNDSIDGDGGRDALSYEFATGAVSANLATGSSSGADGNDTFVNIENLRGSEFNDTLTGNIGDNALQGRAGNDRIDGGAGNDTIHGGFGNDTLTGAAGADVFQYGAGGGEGFDELTDFSAGDVVRLLDGTLTPGVVTAGSNPSGKGVQATTGAGFTTLYIDTDGAAGAEVTLRLDGTYDMTKFVVGNQFGVGQVVYTGIGNAPSARLDGMVYQWKTHTLLDGVTMTAVNTSAGSSGTDLFNLRGIQYDPVTNSATAQVWIDPLAASGAVQFTVSSASSSGMQFTSSLADWSFLANTDSATQMVVGGFAGDGGGVTGQVQVGTIRVNLTQGSAVTFDLTGIEVGGASFNPFTVGIGNQPSGLDGQYHFSSVQAGTYNFGATRGTVDTGTAISSADALAALRIAVGLNPNTGTSLKLSPYQVIAADANEDGKVNSADALAILRMAVKAASAPAQKWIFVSDSVDLWDDASQSSLLSRNAASWTNPAVPIQQDANASFVAVLKGDVNGSWTPAVGAGNQSLDSTNPSYLRNLAASIGEPTDVFGF